MDEVTIIELKESILADNDADAAVLREALRKQGTCLINLMSAPGSGKTSTLLALAPYFEGKIRWGVMEADIDSDVDARTMLRAGIPSVQLHTGGMCHLDADMTRQGIRAIEALAASEAASGQTAELPDPSEAASGQTAELPDPSETASGQTAELPDPSEAASGQTAELPDPSETSPSRAFDLLVLENIGNLVCPAEFDTGAAVNMTILSVPEGDDKPAKYPLMYETCDILVVNKIDALPVFDFDREKMERAARACREDIQIFYISAKTGEGVEALARELLSRVMKWKQNV